MLCAVLQSSLQYNTTQQSAIFICTHVYYSRYFSHLYIDFKLNLFPILITMCVLVSFMNLSCNTLRLSSVDAKNTV